VSVLRPAGAGMTFVPELQVRQLLIEGMVELAGDRHRMDEMFGRVDALLQGTQNEWADEARAVFLELAKPGHRGGARVLVGYPPQEARLPALSIVEEGGAEDESQATFGDIMARQIETLGQSEENEDGEEVGNQRLHEHIHIGCEWTSTLQLSTWATTPEVSVILHAVVKHLMLRLKGRLFRAGVQSVSLSDSGFQPNPDLYPRTGYVPVVRCTMHWTSRQTRRKGPRPATWKITHTFSTS